MSDTKCDVHSTRLGVIENRLERIEDDLDAIVAENNRRTTELAVAEQSFALFREIIVRLEERIAEIETRIDAMLKDRWQIIAGLVGNAAIGVTLMGLFFWMMDHAK